jgi:hypothetical protein
MKLRDQNNKIVQVSRTEIIEIAQNQNTVLENRLGSRFSGRGTAKQTVKFGKQNLSKLKQSAFGHNLNLKG